MRQQVVSRERLHAQATFSTQIDHPRLEMPIWSWETDFTIELQKVP